MNTTNNNNTLKPGDRVILTGWNEDDKSEFVAIRSHRISESDFPINATVFAIDFSMGPIFDLGERLGTFNHGWFTYEKTQDDGSNE